MILADRFVTDYEKGGVKFRLNRGLFEPCCTGMVDRYLDSLGNVRSMLMNQSSVPIKIEITMATHTHTTTVNNQFVVGRDYFMAYVNVRTFGFWIFLNV